MSGKVHTGIAFRPPDTAISPHDITRPTIPMVMTNTTVVLALSTDRLVQKVKGKLVSESEPTKTRKGQKERETS